MKTIKLLLTLITTVICLQANAGVATNQIMTCKSTPELSKGDQVEMKIFWLGLPDSHSDSVMEYMSVKGMGYDTHAIRVSENFVAEGNPIRQTITYTSMGEEFRGFSNDDFPVVGTPGNFKGGITFNLTKHTTYLSCSKETIFPAKKDTEYANVNSFLDGSILDRYCGSNMPEIKKIIGDQCLLFIDTHAGANRYVGVIVHPNSTGPFGGNISKALSLSFPPIGEGCFEAVSNEQNKALKSILPPPGISEVQYLFFKDTKMECSGGVSMTVGPDDSHYNK